MLMRMPVSMTAIRVWELAASGECVGMLGMTGTVEKFG
jgi:hypothetical protein